MTKTPRPYGFDVWEFSNAPEYKMRQGVVAIVHFDTRVEADAWLAKLTAGGRYGQVRAA